MKYQFPDGMSHGNRTGCRLLGGYVVQNLAERISIPCLSVNGGGERVSDAIAFSVHNEQEDDSDALFDLQILRSAVCWVGMHACGCSLDYPDIGFGFYLPLV